jgi:hypothetical protein
MNNLIDRVNRLFSWKSQQYQQESSSSSSASSVSSTLNEYQLQSPPNQQSTNNANSWTNQITDTSSTRHFLANSNVHSAGSELRPLTHFSSSSFNNTNINNGNMSNSLQPLIETSSEYTSESSSLILNQPSVAFSQPASRSNSTVRPPPTTATAAAAAAPLTSMNFTYGIRTNASEPSSSGGGGGGGGSGGSNSNRHRIRHGRHHRSSRSSRSNRAHSNAITNSQNIRSFFTSSNRRSPPSLLTAPTGVPTTTSSTSNNVASNYNHHTTGAVNSLNYLFDNIKKRERNIMSACCAVFTIAILSVSLIETRWFYLSGGGCNVNYIGVAHFFAPGRLESQVELSKITKTDIVMYNFVLPNGIGK